MNEYFYLDSANAQHGPLSAEQLVAQGIARSTLVWCRDMDNWHAAETVREIRLLIEQREAAAAQAAMQAPPPQQPSSVQPDNIGRYGYGTYYAAGAMSGYIPCPPNYMFWAVLFTIIFCQPLGLVAIYEATKVSSYYRSHDLDNALLASRDARNWCIITFVVGITCYLLFMTIYSIV